MKLNKHIDEQLNKQYKAYALMNMCETLRRVDLLDLLQVGFFRNTGEFGGGKEYIVCVKYAQGDNELVHYEWTI